VLGVGSSVYRCVLYRGPACSKPCAAVGKLCGQQVISVAVLAHSAAERVVLALFETQHSMPGA
jgi:hypothetical protein